MITDAVIPVAGLGTRLLPLTRSQPKAMLPLVDRPVVQYVVEELAAAGIRRVLFVIGPGMRALEDHFDSGAAAVECRYARQPRPLGLGDAIRHAESFAGGRPVVVALGDALIDPPGVVPRLLDAYERERPDAVVAATQVPDAAVSRYGILVPRTNGECFEVERLVEKPAPADLESRTAVMGRYVLGPAVFGALRDTPPGAGGEVQLTDALARVAERGRVLGVRLRSHERRHDIGSVESYSAAFVRYALRHPAYGEALRAEVAALLDG